MRFGENLIEPSVEQLRDVEQGKNAARQKKPELHRVGPDHGFDAADISVNQRQHNKQNDRRQNSDAEHEPDRDAGDIDAHASRQRFTHQKQPARRPPRRNPEPVGEKLIRRINLSLEIMRHHHHGEDDPREDVADDHLDETEVAAVRLARHADDRQRAGFGRDDGKADAPPGNIFAPEKIIAGAFLVFAEPHPQHDDAGQIGDDDQPVAGFKIRVALDEVHHGNEMLSLFLDGRKHQGQRKIEFEEDCLQQRSGCDPVEESTIALTAAGKSAESSSNKPLHSRSASFRGRATEQMNPRVVCWA